MLNAPRSSFNDPKSDLELLVSSTQLIGFDQNLQSCHVIVFLQVFGSYAIFYQASGRIVRIGQSETSVAYAIFLDNSYDETKMARLTAKILPVTGVGCALTVIL